MKKLFSGLCALFLLLNFIPTNASASEVCHDIVTIFARGSGGARNTDENYLTFKTALEKSLSANFKNLNYAIYDLDYPAVGINNLPVILGAFFNLDGRSSEYANSVNIGIENLNFTIKNTLTSCPNTKFILAGYSQGAQVVSTSIHKGLVPSDSLIYAATFGDPVIYLPEGKRVGSNTPDACRGKNLSNYRINVPNCYTERGILGANNPYQTAAFINKIGTWCNNKDPFCGAGFSLSDPIGAHLSYKTDGSYNDAVSYIARAVAHDFPNNANSASIGKANQNSPSDTAILIDTSGSMSELIERYKSEAKTLAKKTYATGGRVALYEYRDLSDPYETRKLCDFSCDQAEFGNQLENLSVYGGGDDPESALSASLKVMNELKWQRGANKSVIILTDAAYLSPDRDGTTLSQVVTRSLEIDPVNFYIITPPKNHANYSEWAALTGGQVFSSIDDLSLSTTYITNRPFASLTLENYTGAPGEEFFFDASGSYTENLDHYEWDLDMDGIYEYNSGATSTATHIYPVATSGFVQVKVIDTDGRSSTMSARVTVTNTTNTDKPALSNLQIKYSDADATFTFQKSVNTEVVAVAIEGEIIGFINDTIFTLQNLPENQPITIVFIPIGSTGQTGVNLSSTVQRTTSLKIPNAGYYLDDKCQ